MCYGSGCKYERWDGTCGSRSRGCYMEYIERRKQELEDNVGYVKETIQKEKIKCKFNIGDEDCSNDGLCCYGCYKECMNRCDKYDIEDIENVDNIIDEILYCKNNNYHKNKRG